MLARPQSNHDDIASDLRLRRIGDVAVLAALQREAFWVLTEALMEGGHLKVAFANAHVVNLAAEDPELRSALARSTVLPDGIGVDIGARMLFGQPFPSNLNGTDFTPAFIGSLSRPVSVGLVGARPGVAERAVARLAQLAPHHRYTVFSDGYFDAAGEAVLLHNLAAARPDILLVAFGNPRQEIWIANKIGARHCSVAMGVGALFDFLAGEAPRAPLWLRQLRLEWAWRLALEPARLWRRYILGNPAFMVRVALQKLRGA
jgi:exopolysaccharide biosynthesis WecB/TagA/CpsF family protein